MKILSVIALISALGVMDAKVSAQVNATFNSTAASTASPLTINVTSLPNGTVGTAYSATMSATGGTTPYTWSVVSGTFPPGLVLSSGGAITGTPTTGGKFSFTIRVQDASSPQETAKETLSMTIARLIFKAGFGNWSSLTTPSSCGSNECYQQIDGKDPSTDFSWPPRVWGSGTTWDTGAFAQLYADTSINSSTIDSYVFNRLDSVTGPTGTAGTALYQETTGSSYQGNHSRQDPYVITPDVTKAQGDLYIREWIKVEPDLKTEMYPGQLPDGSWGDWRVLSEWKTGGATSGTASCIAGQTYGGDYRILTYIIMDNNGNLFWRMQGDNNANGGLPYQVYWQLNNTTVPVPVGQWFKYEWFWHRSSGSDGRVWAAVNGQLIGDHHGPNMGQYDCRINRIVPFTVYTGGYFPAYQWVDDLEIWNTFPSDATAH